VNQLDDLLKVKRSDFLDKLKKNERRDFDRVKTMIDQMQPLSLGRLLERIDQVDKWPRGVTEWNRWRMDNVQNTLTQEHQKLRK
jgi:hypothetical protein